jgi:hypothetical protein
MKSNHGILKDIVNGHILTMKDYHVKHTLFIERLRAFFEWHKNSLVGVSTNGYTQPFLGDKLLINGIVCLCTYIEIKGTPYNIIKLDARPYSHLEDAGNGAGNVVTKEF